MSLLQQRTNMPLIENFPHKLNIATPDESNSEFYPEYNQFLCKQILKATDYTQLPNSDISNVEEFTQYRAEIRQIMFSEPKELISYLPPLPNTVR